MAKKKKTVEPAQAQEPERELDIYEVCAALYERVARRCVLCQFKTHNCRGCVTGKVMKDAERLLSKHKEEAI